MKKIYAYLLALVMVIGMSGCSAGTEKQTDNTLSSSSQTTTEQTSEQNDSPYYTILLEDGEKHEFNYLMTLYEENRLKWDQFMEAGGTVEIVGPLDEIGGNMFFKDYGKMVDSYIVLGGSDTENSAWWFGNDKITIETSGMEDEIIDWNHGDTIKITGKISYSCGNLVYMFQDDDNHITVEKLS